MTVAFDQPHSGPMNAGHVRLSCGDPAFVLTAFLGEDPPQLSGGFGGWDVVARPRDVGMTIWNGVEPYQLTLPIVIDAFVEGRSLEDNLRRLETAARGDDESPPGIIRVEGIPSLPTRQWVIENLDYGDVIRRVSDMHRTRQALTLTLREYIAPEYLRRRKSTSRTSSKSIIIVAAKGDTAAKIAKRRKLKSWTVLRTLNRGIVVKANQKIKPGTPILVPATKLAAAKGKGKK